MRGGIFSRDGVFYTNVWSPAEKKKIKERVGRDRGEALARAAQIKAAVLARNPGRKRRGGVTPTLSEYLPHFLATNYSNEKARTKAERTIRRFIAYEGDVRLDQSTKGMLHDYVTRRLRDRVPHPYKTGRVDPMKVLAWEASAPIVAKTTINREIEHLKRVMNHAIDADVIEHSPFAKNRKFKDKDVRNRKRSRYLQEHEIPPLLDAAKRSKNKQFLSIVLLALYIGRRRGDILGLRRRDYDRHNGNLFIKNPKPGEPQWVRVPPTAQKVLDRLHDGATCEWLFPNDGLTGPVKDFDTAFNVAVRRCGLVDFKFHDLRHTAISHMCMAGVDPKTIALLVGHASLAMIDKIYAQVSSKHMIASTVLYGSHMDRLTGMGPTPPQNASVDQLDAV